MHILFMIAGFFWSLFLHTVALGTAVIYLLICALVWKGVASYIRDGSTRAQKLNLWMPLITYGGTTAIVVFGLIAPGILILSSIVVTISMALLLLLFSPVIEQVLVK
jgi:hypothetical protein